ncbi:MAG TPA: response regulator [Bacteroidota bacterium]
MPTKPLRVLVVDDQDSFRMSLEIALSISDKHEVTMSDSGEDAVEKLKTDVYDVVLLDYRMPGMSGLDVLSWMHENKVDAPVIMLTAAGSEEVAVEAMKLGAYDYLSKEHIEIDRLPLTINSVYERYLYRKEITKREREENEMRARQKDMASLQMFQHTVNSIGQFVTNGLAQLTKEISNAEATLQKYVSPEGRTSFTESFTALKHEFDVVSSGMKSMLDLTALVTQKLEGIQNPKEDRGDSRP